MADRPVGPPEDSTPAPQQEPWAELRELLVGPERAALDSVIRRLNDPERRAAETSAVLPQALQARAGDEELQAALMPSVEEAIRISVERDPRVLVNAVFPIIGPAIRKSVSTTLSSMIQSLNETLNRTFSLEGLRWRWEAFRTGRPFGEVVLLRTLEYSVEEVFLVHAETGLLLQHIVDPTAEGQDAQTVSGMLSAIRDFVSDSFRTEAGGSLEGVKVGDLTVLVEAGPSAFLVGVVRGIVPEELRHTFRRTIEDIHREHRRWLESYDGDNGPFEAVVPQLESCLRKRYRPPPKSGRKLAWIAATVGALLLFVGGHATWNQVRWSSYVAALESEDGLVILDRSRGWRGHYVRGLRDPLAADPELILAERGLKPQAVSSMWFSYYSDAPELVLARARQLLRPPEHVELRLENGTLSLAGQAPEDWADQARQLARFVPGVVAYDDAGLNDRARRELRDLATSIESVQIRFGLGSTALNAADQNAISEVAALVEHLFARAESGGVELRLAVTGHTDASGDPETNTRIAGERVRAVTAALASHGIDMDRVLVRNAGSNEPARDARSPFDASHRRVTFDVQIEELMMTSTADR